MGDVERCRRGVAFPGTATEALGAGLLPPGGPSSILVVMMSAVGDAVQVLPILTALKRRFPRARITWLIQEGPFELVRDHPAVDEFIIFRRGLRGRTPGILAEGATALRRTARALRDVGQRQPGGAFDLLLNLQVYFKAGVLTALAPAGVKLGFDWRRTRDLNWLFTTHRIPPHPHHFAHTQDQYMEFLRYLGVDPEPLEYGLALSREERRTRDAFFQSLGRPAVSMVLSSSNREKDWPPEHYAELARRIHQELDLQPVLAGGSSPPELEAARRILDSSPVPMVNAMGDGLRKLLWTLDGSALVVSPDTGPLHMARALRVPVVGLYGYTNPKRSGPYRMFQDLVVDGYARYSGEEYELNMERRAGGMRRISVDMVMEKVQLAMEAYLGRGDPLR